MPEASHPPQVINSIQELIILDANEKLAEVLFIQAADLLEW